MRVAMILPKTPQTPSPQQLELQRRFEQLSSGIMARGVELTVFVTAAAESVDSFQGSLPDPEELLSISRVYERAGDFDLIHNHAGFGPLLFSGLVRTPVLTTVYEPPSPAVITLLKQCSGRNFFVSVGDRAITPDLRLVATLNHADNDRLADEYLGVFRRILDQTHTEDRRPWGYYEVLSDLPDHKVKRIVVWPGKRLSLQRHRRRSEQWTVIQGRPLITLDDSVLKLDPGQSIHVPVGAKHRVANPGDTDVVFIEVQTGNYFGEDDIERFEDDFGRVEGGG